MSGKVKRKGKGLRGEERGESRKVCGQGRGESWEVRDEGRGAGRGEYKGHIRSEERWDSVERNTDITALSSQCVVCVV